MLSDLLSDDSLRLILCPSWQGCMAAAAATGGGCCVWDDPAVCSLEVLDDDIDTWRLPDLQSGLTRFKHLVFKRALIHHAFWGQKKTFFFQFWLRFGSNWGSNRLIFTHNDLSGNYNYPQNTKKIHCYSCHLVLLAMIYILVVGFSRCHW